MRAITLLLAFVVAAAFIVVASLTAVDPWHDEAMLVANLLVPDLDLLKPMPYFDQASPIGYTWLARLLLHLTGSEPPFQVLRILSACLMAGGIILTLLSRPLRTDKSASMIFVALLLASPLVWTYAGEIKHYSAEFFVAALVLKFGWPLADDDRPRTYLAFVLAVVVAALFSFTTPVIVAGVLSGAALMRLGAWWRSGAKGIPLPAAFVVTAGLVLLAVAAQHLLVNSALVSNQMSAYSYVYGGVEDQGIVRMLLARVLGLLDVTVNIVGSTWVPFVRDLLAEGGLGAGASYHAARLFAAFVLAVVLWLGWKRSASVAVTFMVAFVALAVLILAGMVHMPYARHVIFLLPLSVMLVAKAIAYVLERMAGQTRAVQISAVLALVAVVGGAMHGLRRDTQDISVLLAQIEKTDPQLPVWVFGGAQPAVEVLKPRPQRILGAFDKTSGKTAWQVRGGEIIDPSKNNWAWALNPAYPDTIATTAAGEDGLWLLFSNDGFVPDRTPYLAVAERTVGNCRAEMVLHASALYLCKRP